MKKAIRIILTTLVSSAASAQYGSVIDVDRCVVGIMYNFEDKRPLAAKQRDVRKCYDLLPPGVSQRLYDVDRRITPTPHEININITVDDARCKPRKQGAATVGTPC